MIQNDQQYEEPVVAGTEDEAPTEAACDERLREAENQTRTYLANWQRAQADLENYKRRAQLERREAMDLSNSTLVTKLMSALDDLERAFSHSPAEMRKAAWADGVKLSFLKLKSALESEGVQQIESAGQIFDPRFHQAVMRRPGPEGVVVEEVQKGYIMNGRVLRPSMVVVGTQEDNEAGSEQ